MAALAQCCFSTRVPANCAARWGNVCCCSDAVAFWGQKCMLIWGCWAHLLPCSVGCRPSRSACKGWSGQISNDCKLQRRDKAMKSGVGKRNTMEVAGGRWVGPGTQSYITLHNFNILRANRIHGTECLVQRTCMGLPEPANSQKSSLSGMSVLRVMFPKSTFTSTWDSGAVC